MDVTPPQDERDAAKPLSVAELTAGIKSSLESGFHDVWVAGEVSNFSRPSSGHCYFTLKDDAAQLRAVVWRGSAAKLGFELKDGVEIVCHGRIDVYPPRGSYQLVIDRAHQQGVGALELALRRLHEKLAAEGLFDPACKKPLPTYPKRIAIVTSPTGAAVRDFLQVLARRWSGVDVLVIPARVQGEGAAEEIAAGIQHANRLQPKIDTLVVGRGGGSLEDLWCFNEEAVVRAIAASKIPVISAVGHEIDVTLSDLAADIRALTPSEAAERIAPSADDLRGRVRSLENRLHGATQRIISSRDEQLQRLQQSRAIARPHELLDNRARRLDELDRTASRAIDRYAENCATRLAALVGKLETLSPLGVLARGYSVTTDAAGELVKSVQRLKPGDKLNTRLTDGEVASIIEATN